MSRPSRQFPPDPRARQRAVDLARTAGRLGATRVPDEALVLAGPDPSDTAIHGLLVAFESGQLVRKEARADRQSSPGYRAAVAEEMLSTPESIP